VALPRLAILGLALLFGPSACLLDTGPINSVPQVKIVANQEPIYRNLTVPFSATVKDDESSSSLPIRWAVFPLPQNGSCGGIGRADWAGKDVTSLAAEATYPFKTTSLSPLCLCAQFIDRWGATGQDCLKVQAQNRIPVAKITDKSGATTNQMRPLYSHIHLLAEPKTDDDGDPVQFSWSIQDSAGKSVPLAACTDVAAEEADRHRCFTANTPGTYTVTLKATDNVQVNGTITWSDPAVFTIPVNVDTPPCIRRTDPDVRAQRIVLSRSSDLGAAYESRRFQVLNVADDGEPFPVSSPGQTPTQFVWYVFDPKKPSASWVRSTNTSSVFTLSQSLFPDALPGDTVRLRLEVRDIVVAASYKDWPCPADQDLCCAQNTCGGAHECIRWTTWTVQFQP
jgi:hypothetical protein